MCAVFIGPGLSYSKLYFSHIIFLLVLFCFYLFKTHITKIPVKNIYTQLYYFFGIMCAWYSLSLLWSIDRLASFHYLFYMLYGSSIALFLIYFYDSSSRLSKLIRYLRVILGIEILVSLFEIGTSFRWPISPLSSYTHLFGRSATSLDCSDNILSLIFSSPTGFSWNPNNLAAKLVIILPFILFSPNKWIKCLGSVSTFIIILFTTSRFCFVAALIVLFVYFFISYKRIFIFIFSNFIIMILLIYVTNFKIVEFAKSNNFPSQVLGIVYIVEDALYLLSNIIDPSNSLNSEGKRARLIRNGFTALLDSNGLGVGAGGSIPIQSKYGFTGNTTSMHNFWVEILVDSGILFFSLFVFWYGYMFISLIRIALNTRDPLIKYLSKSCAISLLGFTIAAQSPSSCIYLLSMWGLFGFSIAVVNTHKKCKLQIV